MSDPNFKARIMAQKYTKKSSLWKGISYKGTHGNPVQIGKTQKVVSKAMKIDSPTPEEKQTARKESIGRPAMPTRWVSENLDKLATGAKIAALLLQKVQRWHGKPLHMSPHQWQLEIILE